MSTTKRMLFVQADDDVVGVVEAEMERQKREIPGTRPTISAALRSLILKGARATAQPIARRRIERERAAG